MNVVNPSGLFFLDTNIFVYSFDTTSPAKQLIAQDLIRQAIATRRGVISSQVIQGFLSVALRKFARPISISEARQYLQLVLMPLCQHYPSTDFYDRALLLKDTTGYSFYDALIVTSAMEMGCRTLFSEDMQGGRKIGDMVIINPFMSLT